MVDVVAKPPSNWTIPPRIWYGAGFLEHLLWLELDFLTNLKHFQSILGLYAPSSALWHRNDFSEYDYGLGAVRALAAQVGSGVKRVMQ